MPRRTPLLALSLALLLSLPGCKSEPKELPVLGTVPAFSLVDQDGGPFTAETLAGKPWIVDFIFTSCPSMCPKLTAHMRALQQAERQAGRPTHFLSISVDPETDTPPVLKKYAKTHQVGESTWRFVTGDNSAVKAAIQEGFKVSMGERITGKNGRLMDITHAGHFVLLDKQARIRGYYRTDNDGLLALRRDLERVQTL